MRIAYLTAIFIVAAVVLPQVRAQGVAAGWSGEWGAYQRMAPASAGNYRGRAISIKDCAGARCKATLLVDKGGEAHCWAASDLQIQSASEAVLDNAKDGYQCSIALHKTEAGTPSITVSATGKECSAYCTSGAAMNGVFPQRSKNSFFGDDARDCYAGPKPSRLALCTNQALSKLLDQWNQLAGQVSDRENLTVGQMPDEGSILAQCDKAANPADCLSVALKQSIQQLDARKAAWNKTVTEPGDPRQAQQKIAAIAGHYRHTFWNGDISGDKYKTTDTLTIAKAPGNAIRYSLNLNFYNGHQCARSGVAVYKAGGMFVDHTVDPDVGKACYFEVIPTAKGVSFGDPTGNCRESDCGARGGYNGESFTFAQRVKPRR